jgi:U6 snRNA-associated Sm-like protein LSm1
MFLFRPSLSSLNLELTKLQANLVLQQTTERLYYLPAGIETPSTSEPVGLYADISHGTYLIRGENVLLLGEIDLDKDDDAPPGYKLAHLDEVRKAIKAGKAKKEAFESKRAGKLRNEGFVGDEELV